jgi:sugar O-acyltransferase (sialic acid O-acetyltransferase NeuD family)
LILYGASGHGLVIADILQLNGISDIKFWDDQEEKTLDGYEVSMPFEEVNEPLIISIGNNEIRQNIATKSNFVFGKAIHPQTIISNNVHIGDGTVIMAAVVINTASTIGKHCIINTAAVIEHESIIEDYVHVSPNATLCGGVKVCTGAWVGAGAVVIQSITIGKWAIVGAGAVVTRDVPDGAVVVGNPAKIIRINQVHAQYR